MRALFVIMILSLLPLAQASEPVTDQPADGAQFSVTTRYVRSTSNVKEKPIPKDFYNIPRHQETDDIAIELNDVYPESAEVIPNYGEEEPNLVPVQSHQ